MAESVAAAASGGGLSEVLRVGLFPLPPIDCGDGDSAGAAASFPPELKALFAYELCSAFLLECPLTKCLIGFSYPMLTLH